MRTPCRLPPPHATTTLCLALLFGACGGGDVSLPLDGQPAAISVTEGDEQSGRVGEPLAKPLVVQVTDSRGRPIQGATVAFEFNSAGAGASVIPEEKTTNGDGLADARLVLGTTVGRQTGRARVVMGEGSPPVQTSFSAFALSENANSMAAAAGQDQTGHVGQALDDRLVVEVTDGFGNPVAGVPISWSAAGGGSVSEAVVATDEDGRSRVERILGPTVGQQTTLASSEGLAGSPVIFLHTAVAGDASRLIVVSGGDQTGEAGALLPAALVVRLVDAQGNGVPNTAVTWVVATGGGSPSPQTSTTDGEGRASTQWTLGDALGEQRLDAVVSGVGVASFRATATAGAPASLFISTQPSASARNGVRLERQPVIQLRDARGNPVAVTGVQVSAELGGGGELEGTTRQNTDGSGRAVFTDLAISGAPGSRTLVFRAVGYAPVTSDGIQLQAIGTTTAITADSPDPSQVGTPFTVSFRVTSVGSTPTGSVTVSDGVQSCSGGLSSGTGSCSLALTTVGQRTLTATYGGGPGLTGSSDTEPHTVTAAPPPPPDNEAPDADYNWHCEGLTCQFTDASEDDDGNVVAWSWDFGGTGTSSQQNPSHTFPGPGEYQVRLTVTDDDGATDVSTAGVDVEAPPPPNQPPVAEFTWDCDELECDFEDESSDSDGRIESRVWAFGDGNTSNSRNPDHEYASSGTYPVTLTVTDNDGAQGTVTHSVTVAAAPPPNQSPTAAFTESCSNLSCSFDAAGSSDPDGAIVAYSWTFGDGNSASGPSPSHTYAVGGTYTVRLEVRDDDSATDDFSRPVTVTAPPPPNSPPSAAFNPPSCTAGEPCQFTDASSDSDGTITSWSWNFGDGNTSPDRNPSHTYGASGTFSVTLTVADDDGATDTETGQVTVSDPPAPEGGSLGLRTQPPSRIESGDELEPEPEIELLDTDGNTLPQAGVIVSAAIGSGSGTLRGTTSLATDGNGRARFGDLRLDGEEDDRITLAFTAPGFAPVDSQPILIEDD